MNKKKGKRRKILIYILSALRQMTKLMVKCKNCGFKFPSFTQMNEVAFKTAVLTNSAEECPGCSETLAYSKRDYFFE